jgi:hypothetical protein
MAADGAFTADEIGTGNRITFSPSDRAFLESPPTYEEGGSLSPEPEEAPRVEPVTAPPERRVPALLLFVGIAGTASLVLALAAIRMLVRALYGW